MIEEQLIAPPTREIDRRYSVEEIRERPALRQTMPGVEIDTIHFGFNEAFVREEEIENVERIGRILEKIVIANPDEVFMIEGHTDAVGSDPYNLDLSQQRANWGEAVADRVLQHRAAESSRPSAMASSSSRSRPRRRSRKTAG